MRVTINQDVLSRICGEPAELFKIYGRELDDGDVMQIYDIVGFQSALKTSDGSDYLGLALIGTAIDPFGQWESEFTKEPDFLVELAEPGFWVKDGLQWHRCEMDVIRPTVDFFARTAGVLDSDLLQKKSVAIIGLGSGGSVLAVEMARCGVGRLVLVDYDRLETHNIARHVCGLRDVGRLKTRAVRDLVLEKSPYIAVETEEFDILEDPARLREITISVDLVLAATDSESSKMLINRMCLETGVAAIYGGAYERAMGGDVIRVVPGKTPCYDCVIGQVVEELGQPGGGAIDYSSVTDPSQVEAVPGLGLDVAFIALIQAKLALWTLLESVGVDTPANDTNYILWGNRPEWIFTQPFQCVLAKTQKRENCPTCGYEVTTELLKRAEAILRKVDGK